MVKTTTSRIEYSARLESTVKEKTVAEIKNILTPHKREAQTEQE